MNKLIIIVEIAVLLFLVIKNMKMTKKNKNIKKNKTTKQSYNDH